MPSSDIYISPQVSAVKGMHQNTIDVRSKFPSVKDYLFQMAKNLMTAYRNQNPAAIIELNNYHPDYLGKPESFIRQQELEQADFLFTIAKEYGYTDWEQVVATGQSPLHLDFEKALDLLLAGNKLELEEFLNEKPQLILATSSFGHQAQLIHYVGSNGIELWRQVVPLNLPAITKMLIEKGADIQAEVNVYGGTNVAALVSSSGHPWVAGVAEEVLELL